MTLTVPDCEKCKFWKNEASVREKHYKELDAEQWAMWINTRNMRQFLDGFNEALERINTALDAIDFRFIRIEETLNLKPDTFVDHKPNNNFNKPRVNLYE